MPWLRCHKQGDCEKSYLVEQLRSSLKLKYGFTLECDWERIILLASKGLNFLFASIESYICRASDIESDLRLWAGIW